MVDFALVRWLVDTAAKLIPFGFGRFTLSLDRDATKTFWYTFDSDDNRNITPYQRSKRWSLSIFSISPTVFSDYDVKIHGATIYAYHGAVHHWIELEDHVGGVFPGPRVQRDVRAFLDANPPLTQQDIAKSKSERVRISKIGVFDYSLSSEFTLSSRTWGGSVGGDYVALAIVLKLNTRYLFFTCLVPEMTGSRPEPAYFIGQPTVYKLNDVSDMLRRAAGELANAAQLGRHESTTVFQRVS